MKTGILKTFALFGLIAWTVEILDPLAEASMPNLLVSPSDSPFNSQALTLIAAR